MTKRFEFNHILFYVSLIILIPLLSLKSQNLSVGINAGLGTISGNTTSVGSYNIALFIQTESFFADNFYLRLSGLYCGDVDQILGTIKNYNPFLRGISLKGLTVQNVSGSFYMEEGAGLLYLNDRTISSTNADDFGIAFSLLGGIDLTGFANEGFKLGLGLDYGITFNNTLAKYYSLYFQAHFFL